LQKGSDAPFCLPSCNPALRLSAVPSEVAGRQAQGILSASKDAIAQSCNSSRRELLKCAFGLGLGLSLAPSAVLGQDDPASMRPRPGDLFVRVSDAGAPPLGPDDIAAGAAPTIVWPMDAADGTVRSGSRFNRVLLVRLDPAQLSAETSAIAAGGIVAYTVICTHSGCDVTDWLADEQMLYCACHSSKFDPKDRARVVDGPAPRSLPALPLRITDGRICVAKPFTGRVGFDIPL
jgi:rieske iron-sulfur protein